MNNCGDSVPVSVCGLRVAQSIKDLVVIEPWAEQTVRLAASKMPALEVLMFTGAESKGITDIARFTCLSCMREVEIVDDDAEMSTRMAQES